MRKILIAAALTGSVLVAPLPAQASHRPQSGCSPSGDVCQSTRRQDGVRKLSISLASDYFNRYKLCVKAPDDSTTCKRFRIEENGDGGFGDSVRWSKHFPNAGDGAYTVTWKTGGNRVGRRLGFHV